MKSLGIVTVLSVAATALAPSVHSRAPVGAVTAKTVQAFAECFTQAQDRHEAAWAFAPGPHGGTFSNLGADDLRTALYRHRLADAILSGDRPYAVPHVLAFRAHA